MKALAASSVRRQIGPTRTKRSHPTLFIALSFLTVLALTACGGGGGGADEIEAPPAALSAVATTACTAKVVQVQLAGDSTQFGYDGATGALTLEPPAVVLQQILDARFGAGAAVVQSIAVSGTTSADLAPGALTADITVANFGINDSVSMPIESYKALLRGLRPTVFETPNPTYRDIRPLANMEAFAQAMRDVAAETQAPVADVMAYALALPEWQSRLPDEVHPDNAFYRLIVTNVLAPAIEPLVAKLRCQ